MRVVALGSVAALLVACAQGTSIGGTGGAGAGGGSGGAVATTSASASTTSRASSDASSSSANVSSSSGVAPQSCPTDQFATGIDATGALLCAPIDVAAATAITSGCSVLLGWRDGCNGCGLVPSKWGRANGTSCLNGVGVDDTCTSPTLGGATYSLFGLNPDGDVDDNDTFSFGFTCQADGVGGPGPCAAGQFVTAVDASGVTCAPLGALDYVRGGCSLYAGWIDSCNACTTPPFKWGSVTATSCQNGAGADDTCTTQTLGADTIPVLGINTDGDVNDDDKFYIGMTCSSPTPATSMATGTCPAGQLVTGIDGLGGVTCESPGPLLASYVRGHCEIVFGWQDSCNGCTTPPTKWGRVRDGFCENGGGVDDSCIVASLGAASVHLFGLNTDGNVNDDDKFYVDFTCR